MRISDSMQTDSALYSVTSSEQRLLTASQTASSGSKLAGPSSNPVAAAQLARVEAGLSRSSAFSSTISTVRGDTSLAETTLASASDLMAQAKELALEGADGSMNADDRATIATQVSGLKTQLLALANSKGTEGYLFAGTATAAAPFTSTGTFVGNTQDRHAEIGANVVATVNVSGAGAFTSALGGQDAFAALDALTTALNANDSAGISASVSGIDASYSQIVDARSDAGLKLNRLDMADSVNGSAQTSLTTVQSGIVDADLPAAYTQLSQSQTTLENAISVTRNVLSTLGAAQFGGGA